MAEPPLQVGKILAPCPACTSEHGTRHLDCPHCGGTGVCRSEGAARASVPEARTIDGFAVIGQFGVEAWFRYEAQAQLYIVGLEGIWTIQPADLLRERSAVPDPPAAIIRPDEKDARYWRRMYKAAIANHANHTLSERDAMSHAFVSQGGHDEDLCDECDDLESSPFHEVVKLQATLLAQTTALRALVELLDGQTEPLPPVSWQVELAAAKAVLARPLPAQEKRD